MMSWNKRLIAVIVAVVLAFGMIGTAAAQGPRGNGGRDNGSGLLRRDHVLQIVMDAFNEATGLTWQDIVPELKDGKTLNEIFADNGLDPEVVAADVKAQLSAEIDAALADGEITQDAADRLYEALDSGLDRVLDAELTGSALREAVRERVTERISESVDNTLLGTVADLTDMSLAEVRDAWLDAGTLAAVIEANGLDVATVLDTTEAEITERVQELVDNGTLSEERAATYLDGLRARLEARLDVTLPLRDAIRERVEGVVDDTLLGVLAEMAGSTPAEVLRDALTPPSLADIASELGVDSAAVIDETVARITEDVNQQVEEGKLSEERAAELLDGLQARLAERMNDPIISLRGLLPDRNSRPGRGILGI